MHCYAYQNDVKHDDLPKPLSLSQQHACSYKEFTHFLDMPALIKSLHIF